MNNNTNKKAYTNTSRKRTQRSFALESDILDTYSVKLNRKQRRIQAHIRHSREVRLGTTGGMKLAKNRRLDNRTFRVCKNKPSPVDNIRTEAKFEVGVHT